MSKKIDEIESSACRYFVSVGATIALRRRALVQLPGYRQEMLVEILEELFETPELLSSLVDGTWKNDTWFSEECD